MYLSSFHGLPSLANGPLLSWEFIEMLGAFLPGDRG